MIYEKRGHWCFRDKDGKLQKFATEQEAISASGFPMPKAEPVKSSWLEETDNAKEDEE